MHFESTSIEILDHVICQGFFFNVLEKTQGEKNSNSRNFSQKLKQKLKKSESLTQKGGEIEHFPRKTSIFLEEL